jgi:hypothetical protein
MGFPDSDTLALPDPDPLLPDPDPLLPEPELELPEPELELPEPELELPEPELELPEPELLVLLEDAGPLAIASVVLSTTAIVLPERLKIMVRERSGETAMSVGCADSPIKATADVESLLLIAFTIFRTGVGIPAVGNKAFETKARNLKPLSLCCVAALGDFFPPQDRTPTPRTISTTTLERVLRRVRTPKL